MKQKVVIKVSMNCKKSLISRFFNFFCFWRSHNDRSKALMTAARFSGVNKIGLVGKDMDKIEVAGDGVDAVKLTIKLKKKVGFATLESVTEDKGGSDSGSKEPFLALPPPLGWSCPCGHCPVRPYVICE